MQLETTNFGVIEIDEAELINFPKGIPGFEKAKKYVLIGHDSNDTSFFWLQSADDPGLCFVVADPFMVYDNYGVDVSDEDVKLLRITDANNVLTLVMVFL
jgi:flagellar assembly factor FliW